MKKLVSVVLVMVICLGVVASGCAETNQEIKEYAFKEMKTYRSFYRYCPDKFTERDAFALYEYYMMYDAARWAYMAESPLDDFGPNGFIRNSAPAAQYINSYLGDGLVQWLNGEIEMDEFMDMLTRVVDTIIDSNK